MQNFKFAHTADLHIGAGKKIVDSSDSPIKIDYLLRYASVLYTIECEAELNGAEVLIISGDLFHNGMSTSFIEMDVIKSWLKRISKKFLVLAVDGNHDLIKKTKDESFKYTILHHIENIENVHIASDHTRVIPYKGVDFFLTPYGNDPLECARLSKNKRRVLIYHAPVIGSVLHTGRKMKTGEKFGKKTFKFFKYIALGDIHKPQKIGDNAYYPGSPVQHNFGETHKGKILLVDTKNFEPTPIKIKSSRLITVKSPEEATRLSGKDCIVRVISKKAISEDELPENVSKIEIKIPKSDTKKGLSLGKNIKKELKGMGLKKRDYKNAIEELESILQGVLDELPDD